MSLLGNLVWVEGSVQPYDNSYVFVGRWVVTAFLCSFLCHSCDSGKYLFRSEIDYEFTVYIFKHFSFQYLFFLSV